MKALKMVPLILVSVALVAILGALGAWRVRSV